MYVAGCPLLVIIGLQLVPAQPNPKSTNRYEYVMNLFDADKYALYNEPLGRVFTHAKAHI
jgi:hypothetical protein